MICLCGCPANSEGVLAACLQPSAQNDLQSLLNRFGVGIPRDAQDLVIILLLRNLQCPFGFLQSVQDLNREDDQYAAASPESE